MLPASHILPPLFTQWWWVSGERENSQRSISQCRANAQLMHSESLQTRELIVITQRDEKLGTLSWAVSHSIIPLHYLQQPSMNNVIKLLRSVDNIKAGETLFLCLLDIVKLFRFMQFIMAVSVSYVYCFSLYAFVWIILYVLITYCKIA